MYWAINEDGTFEVLDGQQRTVSFCRYVDGVFSIVIDGHPMTINNLTQPQKDQILDYELTCSPNPYSGQSPRGYDVVASAAAAVKARLAQCGVKGQRALFVSNPKTRQSCFDTRFGALQLSEGQRPRTG